MTTEPQVRPATPGDATAAATVSVTAWQAAYAGLLPAEALATLDVAERATFWREALAGDPGGRRVVVAEITGEVVGFAASGPENAPEPTGRGELYAMNVAPAHWGAGAGTALLATVHAALAGDGYAEAVLWVLPGNARARRFYEHHGWADEQVVRTIEVLGAPVEVLRYRRALT